MLFWVLSRFVSAWSIVTWCDLRDCNMDSHFAAWAPLRQQIQHPTSFCGSSPPERSTSWRHSGGLPALVPECVLYVPTSACAYILQQLNFQVKPSMDSAPGCVQNIRSRRGQHAALALEPPQKTPSLF